MAFGVGDIIEGIVGKIVPYGAFVNLPEGKRGLIHISEIANAFVTDVSQYIKEKQTVRVKVLQISPDGRKVDLSIKQLEVGGEGVSRRPPVRRPHVGGSSTATVTVDGSGAPHQNIEDLYRQIKLTTSKGGSDVPQSEFEEKLSKFLKHSEEKLSDVRKNLEAKRGGKRKY